MFTVTFSATTDGDGTENDIHLNYRFLEDPGWDKINKRYFDFLKSLGYVFPSECKIEMNPDPTKEPLFDDPWQDETLEEEHLNKTAEKNAKKGRKKK